MSVKERRSPEQIRSLYPSPVGNVGKPRFRFSGNSGIMPLLKIMIVHGKRSSGNPENLLSDKRKHRHRIVGKRNSANLPEPGLIFLGRYPPEFFLKIRIRQLRSIFDKAPEGLLSLYRKYRNSDRKAIIQCLHAGFVVRNFI